MNNLRDLAVMIQFVREHEMSLHRATVRSGRRRRLRRWIGHQLLRTGTWLANERPMRRPAQPVQRG